MNRSKHIKAIVFFTMAASSAQLQADAFVDPAFTPSIIESRSITSNLTAISRTGNRLVAVGERGHVLVSDNDGSSWQQVEVPTQRLLTDVYFVDDKSGWTVGHDHLILHTQNGGVDWSIQKENVASDLPAPLLNVAFIDERRGLAVGAYGAAYMTADGGKNWENIKNNLDNEDEWHNYGLAISGAGSVYVSGESGTFYRSDDAGVEWQKLSVPFDGTLFGVLPLSGDQVITFGVAGKILYSADKGESWMAIGSGTQASFYGASLVNKDLVALVGAGGVMSLFSVTEKKVATINSDDRITLSDVIAVEDGMGLVGMAGYKFVTNMLGK